MSPDLLPERVLSGSPCICDFFPDDWTIEWTSTSADTRVKDAASFGISSPELPAVVDWATKSVEKSFGWTSAFYSLEAAQDARARFFPNNYEIVLFSLALHESIVEDFLTYARPSPPQPGCAPMGEAGIFQCINAARKIAEGGETAGFELLSTLYGIISCSWLCNGLEKDCADQLGVVPNRLGFVPSYEEALRCAKFISRPETGAEPGLWLPWLVTVY